MMQLPQSQLLRRRSLEKTARPAVDDVFITDELQKRTPKTTDYLEEKRALQDLAGRMADHPGDVLPRFVDLALAMTGGVAGGLSLYEPAPAPGVFRWQYLRGTLERFNGTTTPRNFSPCGVTLDQNRPVLSAHPERVYRWIADANITVPEVLLVPLYLGGAAPLGTLWIVSDRPGHFDSGHARVMTELASFVGIALRMLQAEQHLQRSLEEQRTLAEEMSHRVKNLFAVTHGLIRLSAKDADTKDDLVRIFCGRLEALSGAHALARREFGTSRSSDLGDLIRTIVRPYEKSALDSSARFLVDGPLTPCADHATNGVALVVHELATNAAKYGALCTDDGEIDISWREVDGNVLLRWSECGGPLVGTRPAMSGFGSSLVQTIVVNQLGGSVDYDWRPDGLVVKLSIPVQRLSI
jgi:two-component sensor histidine kinase